MMREHVQIDLTKTPNGRRNGILSLLVIFTIIVPAISVHAEIGFENKLPLIYWKHYPYRPSGTELIFPNDEGAHATQQYPIEWWYANFHLKGQSTGQEYGSFIAFYKIQTTFAEKQEIRIFSISDIAAEKTYTNAQIGTLTASTDHLNLSFGYITKEYDSYNQSGMSMVTGI